jgi:dTDP-4-dehydrorhamnose 3,5-epimerase
MEVTETSLPGVLIVKPDVFSDARGFFMESYHRKRYREVGFEVDFVQDNISFSVQGTLRGLHYQYPHGQAKLIQVLQGEVFDVAVDIRAGSPAFGQWTGVALSADSKTQLFIPAGFAHGFCVLSDTALFTYKCSDFYAPASERGILWSDPAIGIRWPIQSPLLSDKDRRYPLLGEVASEHLPP